MTSPDAPAHSPRLLPGDPQPTLIVSAELDVIETNAACHRLMQDHGLARAAQLLPVNTLALIRSALEQDRPISDVESRLADTILLWCFVPDAPAGQVLIRGRDATGDTRARDEAIRSSRLYRLITENTTDLISRHAPDGRFIDATPASWRLLGYWPEELRGKPLEEVFEGQNVTTQLALARERLQDEGYATLTLEIRHRNGSRRWFEISSRAIRETYTGTVVEVVSVSRDITARVESEAQNRRLADELAHAARLATLGELTSSIAHEMNQPLASIVNFASASQRFLREAGDHPDRLSRVDDGLQKIVHHANRASEVIRRLRAFLGKGQKRSAPIALNTVIDDVIRLCQWEAEKNNVQLNTELAHHLPTLTADPVLLEQVLINLIRNAIEANAEASPDSPNAPASEIVIRTHTSARDETLLSVTDQGPGLDDEGIRQMFQPFYTSKSKGLGLGLSMSRSIIEGFGGFLDASRAETGGLTLTCRFPPNNNRVGQQTSQE